MSQAHIHGVYYLCSRNKMHYILHNVVHSYNRNGLISNSSMHLINFSIFYNLLSISILFLPLLPFNQQHYYHPHNHLITCVCFAVWFLFLNCFFRSSFFIRSNCLQLKIVVWEFPNRIQWIKKYTIHIWQCTRICTVRFLWKVDGKSCIRLNLGIVLV